LGALLSKPVELSVRLMLKRRAFAAYLCVGRCAVVV
jgi:hypothetical protein